MKFSLSKETLIAALKKTLTSPLFWILIITVFLLRTILFTSGIPSHGDLTYPSSIIQYQKALFPLWNESTSDSNLESIDRGFSLLLVLFVRLIGGEVDLLSKLYFFIPMFISGVTAAYLTKYILQKIYPDRRPSTFAIIVASFIFMISPWVLEQVQAPFFWLSYAVTPGIILLAYRFFSEGRLSLGIGLAVLWTLASTTPHYTLYSFLIIFFIWICSHAQFQFGDFKGLAQSLRQHKVSELTKYIQVNWGIKKYLNDLKLWVPLLFVFMALNAYWIVMTAFLLANGTITPGYVFTSDMLKMFSSNANQHVLSGTDQWISWWPGQYSSIIQGLIAAATLALPAFLIGAVVLAKKDKGNLRLLFIIIGIWIIGVFFSLGINNPVYTWLATSSPLSSAYGWLLRVPGKISYLLWPAYAVSIGLVAQSAYSYCSSKKKGVLKKKTLVLTLVAVLLIASNGYAVIKAEDYFNYYYAPVLIPTDYQQAFSFLSNNLTDPRVADLARYENGSVVVYENLTYILQQIALGGNTTIVYSDGGNDLKHSSNLLLDYDESFEASYTWNEHRIAGYFVPRSITVPAIGNYHFTYSGIWEPAYANFQDNVSRTLWYAYFDYYRNQLVPYSVNISRLENVNPAAALWFPVYGVNYILYHNDIFNTTDYAQHDLQVLNDTGCKLIRQWGNIYLYSAPQTFGRIYALNSSWTSIESQLQPPTSADVNASGVKLYDIKQVDPTHWELNVNASNSFSLIFSEGFDSFWSATVDSNNGSFVYNSQNAFGSINSFSINQTGELHITLQYRPQTWLYYGITASILLLMAAIGSISYVLFRRKKITTQQKT